MSTLRVALGEYLNQPHPWWAVAAIALSVVVSIPLLLIGGALLMGYLVAIFVLSLAEEHPGAALLIAAVLLLVAMSGRSA